MLMLEPATANKEEGARLFKLGDWAAADEAYAEAMAAVPGAATGPVWPAAESLLIALHANRAMCLLKAGNAEAAAGQVIYLLCARSRPAGRQIRDAGGRQMHGPGDRAHKLLCTASCLTSHSSF